MYIATHMTQGAREVSRVAIRFGMAVIALALASGTAHAQLRLNCDNVDPVELAKLPPETRMQIKEECDRQAGITRWYLYVEMERGKEQLSYPKFTSARECFEAIELLKRNTDQRMSCLPFKP